MNASSMHRIRRFTANRVAVVAAASVGFLVGAAGLAAADGLGGSDDPSGATTTTVDDATGNTIVGDDDNSTSTTVDDDSTTSTTVDDDDNTTSTTVDDDDNSTSTTVAAVAPFTRTYTSRGGSVTVTWNGTSLSIDAISPAAGYAAEIEDSGGDRVRVDFEGDDDDARIEVRVDDGELREEIEG